MLDLKVHRDLVTSMDFISFAFEPGHVHELVTQVGWGDWEETG
jgi:hypothetical protein